MERNAGVIGGLKYLARGLLSMVILTDAMIELTALVSGSKDKENVNKQKYMKYCTTPTHVTCRIHKPSGPLVCLCN
jgi:hypothetical protein